MECETSFKPCILFGIMVLFTLGVRFLFMIYIILYSPRRFQCAHCNGPLYMTV